MEATERAMLAGAVRAALRADAADADAALAGVDWLEMLRSEPREAIAVVFEALGTEQRSATALDDVVVSALGLAPRADLAVVLPAFGKWTPPGASEGDARVRTCGLSTARVRTARDVLLVYATASDVRASTMPAAAVAARAVHGVDPAAGLCVVDVDHPAAGATVLEPGAWPAAVALGRRAVAHQISGACRSMLALARTHAIERVQFGRPIASFQAVRHRLAETLVAIESLDAALQAAADGPGDLTAALAKATAGRAARTVATHCQQVLAGIGFTTDHPFHHLLKRTMLLDGLFGTADDIAADVGHRLLADRRVPTLVEL